MRALESRGALIKEEDDLVREHIAMHAQGTFSQQLDA